MLNKNFFNQDALCVARKLLGKIIRAKYKNIWLSAMITETEAYYIDDKASHSSLGYTEKRKALFMPPGTIYMYYARGGDSLNVSVKGKGNAVLIKSALPYIDQNTPENMISLMQKLNPLKNSKLPRPPQKLCAGQTLLCNALNLKVKDWDQKQFDHNYFYFEDIGFKPTKIIQTTRLGIPKGRDEDLLYRFIMMSMP
jgi:DNA-3-methyladenine glycosylase